MHINFSDIVNEVADGGWGRNYDSREAAVKAIVEDKQLLAALASVELIKRLNAFGRDDDRKNTCNRVMILDGSEARFPNKAVGDLLYSGSLEDGFRKHVIIAKDDEHRCMIVAMNEFNLEYPPIISFAREWHKETMVKAVKEEAERDVLTYSALLANAKAAFDAATNGNDMSKFTGGYDVDVSS